MQNHAYKPHIIKLQGKPQYILFNGLHNSYWIRTTTYTLKF